MRGLAAPPLHFDERHGLPLIQMTDSEILRCVLETYKFDRKSGQFFFRKDSGSRGKKGALAGTINGGYVLISVSGRQRMAHHLVWLLEHGEMPKTLIDHRDGNGLNNRPSNLRKADRSLNAANRLSRSKFRSRVAGVVWDKQCGKWKVRVQKDGTYVFNRTFTKKSDAIAARLEQHAKFFGEFTVRQ